MDKISISRRLPLLWVFVLGLGCANVAAPAAAENNGIRVYVDPQTGQIAEPPAAPSGPPATPAHARRKASTPLKVVPNAAGGSTVILDDSFADEIRIRTAPGQTPDLNCVHRADDGGAR